MLFFYVMQKELNAVSSSPLGSCTDGATDPACPNPNDPVNPESYYSCPAQGCITYTVRLKADVSYDPGASGCGDSGDSARFTDPTAIYRVRDDRGNAIYEQTKPLDSNRLVYAAEADGSEAHAGNAVVVDADERKSSQGYWHSTPKRAPACRGTPSNERRSAGGGGHADQQ